MTAEYIETDEILLTELEPFPGNAWEGDVDKIAESITEHGQYRPLVVRRTGDGRHVVVAGNHTMLALASLGRRDARCEVHAMDDVTAVKINLLDNRSKDWGGYDNQALLELLKPLADDLAGTGYDPDALDDLLAALEPAAVVLPEPGPTGARYAESPEEEEARRERIDSYEPRHGGGDMTELILVMTVAQRTEAGSLIRTIRERDGDLTAGEVALYALRVHAGADTEDEVPEGDDA